MIEEQYREDNLPKETMASAQDGYEDGTLALWNNLSRCKQQHNFLVIKNLNKPEIEYKTKINDIIHIGRKNADIVIEDKYVSAKHCDVILRDGKLFIKDVGSTNGTFYEKEKINNETLIVSGGIIEIGQFTYSVELLKE